MPKDSRITTFSSRNMTKTSNNPRRLEWWERQQLERQGCFAADWDNLLVGERVDLDALRHVEFAGKVVLTRLDRAERPEARICHTYLCDVKVGANPVIERVGEIRGLRIGADVTLKRDALITMRPEAPCGMGVEVAVLDETGTRPAWIYPGISAQMGALMARLPHQSEERLKPLVMDYIDSLTYDFDLGDGVVITDCGAITDVRVWPGVTIEGALRLDNGSVINNAPHSATVLAHVGPGCIAENFIIEDGVLDTGASAYNSYIGQGAVLGKGFTSHDSLFFANSTMENGEACAVLAGPYSVSVHKSTLLIGCVISFMNAGSATNQSNHMYKLGPVHWGVLQRGVKTSSNSYLMHGAKIGAFSLLMGDHKTHPDSSEFPFSYLFGDEKGSTVVVPAMMLRSCGLLRDEQKWPKRDKRVKSRLPLHDRIDFPVLNPHTVSHILKALDTIDKLLMRPADDDRFVRYKGMKFSRASLERARMIYGLAIYKYLHTTLGESPIPERKEVDKEPHRWIDLCGQLVVCEDIERVFRAESLKEAEQVLDDAQKAFAERERRWIGERFGDYWRERSHRFALEAERFDEMVDEDRRKYREDLRAENEMLRLV